MEHRGQGRASTSKGGGSGSGGTASGEAEEPANNVSFWERNRAGRRRLLAEDRGSGGGILRKLMRRECIGCKPSASANAIRTMCVDVFPSKSCVASKLPDLHVRGFTPDGRHLVCFSLNLRRLLVHRYQREGKKGPEHGAKATFDQFFRPVFDLEVCGEGEQLCKSFSACVHGGRFLLVASSAKCSPARGGDRSPAYERVAIHVVDLEHGVKTDEVVFEKDFVWLTQNQGISIHENVLSVLSVRNQEIRLFHASAIGRLVKLRTIGDFVNEDDEDVLASMGAGDPPPQPGPFSAIQQRLLGHLVTRAVTPRGWDQELIKEFLFKYRELRRLEMVRAQLLGGDHLLIRFEAKDRGGYDFAGAASGSRYHAVFCLETNSFCCVVKGDEEIARLYRHAADFFRAEQGDDLWHRMASTYMNDAWLRDTLERQRGRYQKIYGSEAELLKQVCSVLPLTPHAFSSSPYLDSRLYQFDERYISSSQGPRPVPEGAVKFLARGEGGVTRFRIDPGDDEDEQETHDYVLYAFHPSYPLVVSSICDSASHLPKCVKFFYR